MKYSLAVLDMETDPFQYGRAPIPFAVDLFDGIEHVTFWGPKCIDQLMTHLQSRPPLRIYAHNGGKFDFMFMLDHLDNPLKVINSRIVKAKLLHHELRDSYAIIPIPLRAYAKDDIDYSLMEAHRRERHKKTIIDYLHADTRYLFELVENFVHRFGDALTIGTVAMNKLREAHPSITFRGQAHDEKFRSFYSGGRVECFEHGLLQGDFKVFDVNSMYPYVMAEVKHPLGGDYSIFKSLKPLLQRAERHGDPFFVHFVGESKGAIPQRDHQKKLGFPHGHGEFFCTGHEFMAGLHLGLVKPKEIRYAWVADHAHTFSDYVSTYYAEKVAAKQRGDKLSEIFAKLLLNSAYGKFGQSPESFEDYYIRREGDEFPQDRTRRTRDAHGNLIDQPSPWTMAAEFDSGEIWKTAALGGQYKDVAVAASITGAARAVLLNGIAHAKRPVYCDTDSLICEDLSGVEISPEILGAWKYEGSGDTLGIAGKKVYCLLQKNDVVKYARKGFTVSDPKIILDICQGKVHTAFIDAPNMKLNGEVRFTKREIRATF